ncbi:helix-turn-helix transcriptional regulator [Arcanobacterium phocisimile]|uniref:Helix-turn-helix transcriptional regulator n=1 Tax=Arcanobacterium phocisimile TaxID=1302235 RepID=A0ABX7IHK0_9ACTO|nr:helix-turn-helix transcriptional regulator [Arcanobacterium phocisimile]QRV02292.1 helix-turn-helix transcriptional regulator [Arcanobacterium phocisimile]
MLNRERRESIRKRREQNKRDRQLISDLVEMRKKLGIEQVEIAQKMSVSQSTISRFESGQINPTQQTIRRYARIVGVSIEYRLVPDVEIRHVVQNVAVYQEIPYPQYGDTDFTVHYSDKVQA